MNTMKKVNTVALVALSSLALAISCSSPEQSQKTDYPLGIFDFDLDRLAEGEAGQIGALKSIGYTGLLATLRTERDLEALARFEAAIDDSLFKIYGGYTIVNFSKDLEEQSTHIDNMIRSLVGSKGKLCLVLHGKDVPRKDVVDFMRSTAERCKAAGIELVLFPHVGDNYIIKSAEEALPYIEEIQSDNIFVSFHLSHEFLASNGNRLNEVAANIRPWIRLPSINGTDVDLVNGPKRLQPGVHIKPLGAGDYDSSQLLEALKSVDYEGPVILHSWGLEEAPVEHYETSFQRFQEMVEELD